MNSRHKTHPQHIGQPLIFMHTHFHDVKCMVSLKVGITCDQKESISCLDISASSCCKGVQNSELCSSLCIRFFSFKFPSSHLDGGGLSSTSLGSLDDEFRSDICYSFGSAPSYNLLSWTRSPSFELIWFSQTNKLGENSFPLPLSFIL